MSLDDQFQTALDNVKTLPSTPSNESLLELYGLFKQATTGDAQGKRPGMFSMEARAKWDAWNGRKGMSKDQAMDKYVATVERLEAD